MTYSDSRLTFSDPKMTYSYPKVNYSDPKMTCNDPKVTYSDPYSYLPHYTSAWPLVDIIKCPVVVVVMEGGNQL